MPSQTKEKQSKFLETVIAVFQTVPKVLEGGCKVLKLEAKSRATQVLPC